MKTERRTRRMACIPGIIIFLGICLLGVIAMHPTGVRAFADSRIGDETTIASPQFDIVDYDGDKVYATYAYERLNSEECAVYITNKKDATVAEIPSKAIIDGIEYTVTQIASNGFISSPNLVSVTLSRTIKKIQNMAFANCGKLQYVDLKVVEEIGSSVFYRCGKLDLIVIPKTVRTLGANVFRLNTTQVEVRAKESDCTGWNSIWNAYNNNQDVHYESKYKSNPQVEYIYDETARTNNAIKGLMIVKGQPNVNEFDLIDQANFVADDIIIPKEYTYTNNDGDLVTQPILAIQGSAFEWEGLNNLIIEYSEVPIAIGSSAFTGLMPNGDGIGINVIINRAVEYRDYEDQVQSSNGIFTFSQIESIILPANCDIAEGMFSQCDVLKNIFFQTPKPFSGNEATALLNLLSTLVTGSEDGVVTVPETVGKIGDAAFENTSAISTMYLSSEIKDVGASIVRNWNNESQTVVVQNETPIIFKTDDDPTGWALDWHAEFSNIKYTHYDIKFQANGYLPGGDSKRVEYGKAIGKLPIPVVGEYEKFMGWFLGSEVITKDTLYTFEHDITLMAKISPFCTIIFHTNNSDTDTTFAEEYVLGEKMPSVNKPSKAYYTFEGYYDNEDGNGDPYYTADMVANRQINTAGNIDLYAKYTPTEYSVTYDLQDSEMFPATNSSQNKTVITHFDTMTLSEPSRYRFRFGGWYKDGKPITELKEVSGNIIVTARWIGDFVELKSDPEYYSNSPCTIVQCVKILKGQSYEIVLGPQVEEFYLFSDARLSQDITLNIIIQDKRQSVGGIPNDVRTSDIKVEIRNLNIAASYGHHAILMDSERYTLRLWAYKTKIIGSDTLIPASGPLAMRQGSSAIYCKHLAIYTSVMLKGGSNDTSDMDPYMGGVAVSLMKGGDVMIMSDENINIIGGDGWGVGIAGYAVYADKNDYKVYGNAQIRDGSGAQSPSEDTPPYIGY